MSGNTIDDVVLTQLKLVTLDRTYIISASSESDILTWAAALEIMHTKAYKTKRLVSPAAAKAPEPPLFEASQDGKKKKRRAGVG